MEKKVLLEQIKRMHEIIGVNPTITLEAEMSVDEVGIIPGTSKAAQMLARVLVSDIIEYGGVKYTRVEVRKILNKVGLKALNKEESEVVKIATSRVIAKDAGKSVLDTIAKTFVADLKAITDDAVAAAEYQEFKNLAKTVLKAEDFKVLEKNIQKETEKIVRPVKPEDLTSDKLRDLAKGIDGSAIKNLNAITSEFIATVRKQNPGLNTTELIQKIISGAPEKTFTTANVLKWAGKAFDGSSERAGQFVNFVLNTTKKVAWGKIGFGTLTMLALYVIYKGVEGYGEEHQWSAFKKEIDKIKDAHPCLFDPNNGAPLYISPADGYYLVKDSNGKEFPAVWDNSIKALYYVQDKKNLDKKTGVVQC